MTVKRIKKPKMTEATYEALKRMFKVRRVVDRREEGKGIFVQLRKGYSYDPTKEVLSCYSQTVIEAAQAVRKAVWIGA